jgi:hypothetical protein
VVEEMSPSDLLRWIDGFSDGAHVVDAHPRTGEPGVLEKSGPGSTFYILGEGQEMGELKRLVDELHSLRQGEERDGAIIAKLEERIDDLRKPREI